MPGAGDANVRERLAKNATRLARMSEQDASRQLKLKQMVNLDYVNAIIVQIEQMIDEFIPQNRKHIFDKRFEKLLEPKSSVLTFPRAASQDS